MTRAVVAFWRLECSCCSLKPGLQLLLSDAWIALNFADDSTLRKPLHIHLSLGYPWLSSYALNHGIPYGPSADLGFGVCAGALLLGSNQTPQQSHPLSPLHEPLQWRAKRDPKAKMLSLQSFLRNGVSLGYVGRNYNLKDLKGYPLFRASARES